MNALHPRIATPLSISFTGLSAVLLAISTGCTSMEYRPGPPPRSSPSPMPGRVSEPPSPAMSPASVHDLRVIQEENRRIFGRMDDLERQIAELNQRQNQMASQAPRDASQEVRQLQSRIEGLERGMAQWETQQRVLLERNQDNLVKEVNAILTERLRAMTPRDPPRNATTNNRPAATAPAPSTESLPTTGFNHVVKEGETISALAVAYTSKSDWIMRANNITDASKVRVGQKLFIPVAE